MWTLGPSMLVNRMGLCAIFSSPVGPSCAFGPKRGEAFVTLEAGTDPYVKIQPDFDDLAFGNCWMKRRWARAVGSMQANRPPDIPRHV